MIESWRRVWRDGFAPLLSGEQLKTLRDVLATDDVRLTQGSTTTPPPLLSLADFPCDGACVVGVCGVAAAGGWGAATVGEVEEEFARLCFEADERVGEPAACRYFLHFVDDTPRTQMLHELLGEVELELSRRAAGVAA